MNRNDLQAHLNAERGVEGLPGWRVSWESVISDAKTPTWFIEFDATEDRPAYEMEVKMNLGSAGWRCWEYTDTGEDRMVIAQASARFWSLLDAMRDAERAMGLSKSSADVQPTPEPQDQPNAVQGAPDATGWVNVEDEWPPSETPVYAINPSGSPDMMMWCGENRRSIWLSVTTGNCWGKGEIKWWHA